MIRISNFAALDAWLSDRHGFEDGHLARAERSPSGQVALRLEEYVLLGTRPGDVSVVDVHELIADDPIEFFAPLQHDPAFVLEGVEAGEFGGRLFIQIEAWPDRLRLLAEEFTVRHIATEHRRTEPWVGDEFTVVAGTAHDDQFWTSRAGELLATTVVWRVLGDPEPRVAGRDPDGCFLQKVSRLTATDRGVLCLRGRDGRTTFRRCGDEADADLWQAVRMVAVGFDQIRAGNCVFEPADWATYITKGKFPPDDDLRSALTD